MTNPVGARQGGWQVLDSHDIESRAPTSQGLAASLDDEASNAVQGAATGGTQRAVPAPIDIARFGAPPVTLVSIETLEGDKRFWGPNDRIRIERFNDPDIDGVTCFLTRVERGGFLRLLGLAEDADDVSISCSARGPVELTKAIAKTEELRGPLFFGVSNLHVTRVFDEAERTLLYVAHGDGSRTGDTRTAIAVIALSAPKPAPQCDAAPTPKKAP